MTDIRSDAVAPRCPEAPLPSVTKRSIAPSALCPIAVLGLAPLP